MDTNTKDEVRRLLVGLRTDEGPKGFGVAGYRVTCRRDSFAVLECVRETLAFILTFHLGMVTASNIENDLTDPDDITLLLQEQVMSQLTEWYRQRFNLSANDTSVDCVRGFTWSRDWRWWDWRIRSEEDFLLLLDVSGWPCSGLTPLRSVLYQCGAASMDEIPEAEW
jgi:hypothetical protein